MSLPAVPVDQKLPLTLIWPAVTVPISLLLSGQDTTKFAIVEDVRTGEIAFHQTVPLLLSSRKQHGGNAPGRAPSHLSFRRRQVVHAREVLYLLNLTGPEV